MSQDLNGECSCVNCKGLHKAGEHCPDCQSKTKRQIDVRIESAGAKVAGIVFLVLSVMLAIEVVWVYGLDLLFLVSYCLWMFSFALGVALVFMGMVTTKSIRSTLDLDKFGLAHGTCHRCGKVGQIYYPKGLNNPILHRCEDHIDTLIM